MKNSTEKFLIPDFSGKKILITAGPTHEAIDPVRYIGNHSSGKMGFALAEAFAETGGEVYLISGPTHLNVKDSNIRLSRVTSAAEMHSACLGLAEKMDVLVFSAAVADFRPETVSLQKIKRDKDKMHIRLVPTVDIAKDLGSKKTKEQIFIGFALETSQGIEHAKEKLVRKNLDMIVLNSLEDEGAGFGTDTNKITIIDKSGNIDKFDLKLKHDVARDIMLKTYKLLIDA